MNHPQKVDVDNWPESLQSDLADPPGQFTDHWAGFANILTKTIRTQDLEIMCRPPLISRSLAIRSNFTLKL